MKFMRGLLLLLSLYPTILFAQDLAPGTVIPAMLKRSISTRDAHVGAFVQARVMQEVLAADKTKIPAGSILVGEVTRVERDTQKGTTLISLRFDHLESHGKRIPIVSGLRALASYVAVAQAQIPPIGASRTVPYEASTFELIGGDVSYRGGGPVMHGNEDVGKPSSDGVLVRVLPNPERGCNSPADSNTNLQSLWMFSSNACGIYGLATLNVVDRGLNSGEFTLSSPESVIELHSGSGLLLMVILPVR